MKEHQQHMQKVLMKLQEAKISANVDKCEFHVTKTKYFELIINVDSIKMDPVKVKALK